MEYPQKPKNECKYNKLTEVEREKIRKQYLSGRGSSREIGREFGVSKTTVLVISSEETKKKAYKRNSERRKQRLKEDPQFRVKRRNIEKSVQKERQKDLEVKKYYLERGREFRKKNPEYKKQWRLKRKLLGLKIT